MSDYNLYISNSTININIENCYIGNCKCDKESCQPYYANSSSIGNSMFGLTVSELGWGNAAKYGTVIHGTVKFEVDYHDGNGFITISSINGNFPTSGTTNISQSISYTIRLTVDTGSQDGSEGGFAFYENTNATQAYTSGNTYSRFGVVTTQAVAWSPNLWNVVKNSTTNFTATRTYSVGENAIGNAFGQTLSLHTIQVDITGS